jgi:hypothetical protein
VRRYDEQGRSDYQLGGLLLPLMPLAYYSAKWQFILEYGERAIDIGIRITGLHHAAELAPELGREEALKRGLAVGAAAFAEHATDVIGYDLKSAISATIGMVAACAGVYATCFDSETVSRVARAVAPLALFGEEHVAYAMYLFAAAEAPMIGGRESEAYPVWEDALARFESPAFAKAIGPRAKVLQGGALFMLTLLDSYHFGERALDTARRMESLGVKAWRVTADQIRLLYHALRGESNEVKSYIDRVEHDAVRGAQTWQTDIFWPSLLLNADVLTGDTIAARRRYVQLERRSQEVATLKPQAEAAHAAYLMLRGDLPGAISLYERLLPSFPCRRRVDWETTRGYFARALNLAGAHERARAVAEEVVRNMVPADHAYVARFLEAERQLALAESGLGNHARAAELLDGLLAKHGHESNPLLLGLLHQARAEVAERAGDRAAVDAHRAAMEIRFRKTQNPLLIAQCERAHRSMTLPAVREGYQPFPNTVSSFHTLPAEGPTAAAAVRTRAAPATGHAGLDEVLTASAEPLEAAVQFVMTQTKAKSASLYALTADELRLVWSSTNEEPPARCVAELGRWVNVARENARNPSTKNDREPVRLHSAAISGYLVVALQRAADAAIVGGLILEGEPSIDRVGSTEIFDALGRIVEDHATDAMDAMGFITA